MRVGSAASPPVSVQSTYFTSVPETVPYTTRV